MAMLDPWFTPIARFTDGIGEPVVAARGQSDPGKLGSVMSSTVSVLYVLKRYPRLSKTFVVREILGLEAAGVGAGGTVVRVRSHAMSTRRQLAVVADPARGRAVTDVPES